MIYHGNMEINEAGHLCVGGCDLVELGKTYGTPLYVFDEQAIRDMCRLYRSEFEKRYHSVKVLYASKAFLTKAMALLITQEGAYLDVCSQGEIYTATSCGISGDKLYYHGNNKTEADIRFALQSGIERFMVDNEYELTRLNEIAGEMGKFAHCIIRLTPGIEAHTHEYIRTGQIDSKFGVAISTGAAMRAVKLAVSLPNIRLHGVHCHIGSQIFDLECFEEAANVMMKFAKAVKDETGCEFDELDLGGGLGIKYTSADKPNTVAMLAEVMTNAIKRYAGEYGLKEPNLLIEPGRSMIGEYGTTIYNVGFIKDIPGIRKYVGVNGGMVDNPRVALYQAKYDAVIANRASFDACEVVTIAGNACESGDMLIRDIKLPKIEVGDTIAIFSTGAYNFSMASNYNRYGRPAAVFVKDKKARLVVKRESPEDVVKNDVVPEDFK